MPFGVFLGGFVKFGKVDQRVNADTGFTTITVETDDPIRLSSMVRGALSEDTLIGIWGGGEGKYYFTVADVEVAQRRLRSRGCCDELNELAALLK